MTLQWDIIKKIRFCFGYGIVRFSKANYFRSLVECSASSVCLRICRQIALITDCFWFLTSAYDESKIPSDPVTMSWRIFRCLYQRAFISISIANPPEWDGSRWQASSQGIVIVSLDVLSLFCWIENGTLRENFLLPPFTRTLLHWSKPRLEPRPARQSFCLSRAMWKESENMWELAGWSTESDLGKNARLAESSPIYFRIRLSVFQPCILNESFFAG